MTTLTRSDYCTLGAAALAALIRSGEVRPADVFDAAAGVLTERNPAINAVIATYDCEMRTEGPLAGVPLLLKDLGAPCAGTRTTFGSALFADAPLWSHDCVAVQRLRQAGAAIIGRSNSGEFGITLTTEPAHYGATHNPWRRSHSAGGSSGGSAAAVAAHIVPLAHGTDGCGSLRVPASHCGLFSMKPSRALVPFAPDMGESWAGMSSMGALARTVEDFAIFLDVTAGPSPGDPYFAAPLAGGLAAGFREPPGRLRVGVVFEAPSGFAVHGECLKAVDEAASVMRSMGHEVEPARLPFDYGEAIGHLTRIWAAQLWALTERRYRALGLEPDGSGMEPLAWLLARSAMRDTAADYWAAVQFLHQTCRTFVEKLSRFDVLLSPVAANPPEPHGWAAAYPGDFAAYAWEMFRRFPFTVPFNVTGRPAMSVPLHVTADGLPVGVQIAGRMGDDLMLLRLAFQFERNGAFRRPS
ncbi:MAG: amidase [Hyphomonadaceae bacterium]|nr:amidase [Hyphomonadaceae bacterium]